MTDVSWADLSHAARHVPGMVDIATWQMSLDIIEKKEAEVKRLQDMLDTLPNELALSHIRMDIWQLLEVEPTMEETQELTRRILARCRGHYG
jgi:hypothetical protein